MYRWCVRHPAIPRPSTIPPPRSARQLTRLSVAQPSPSLAALGALREAPLIGGGELQATRDTAGKSGGMGEEGG